MTPERSPGATEWVYESIVRSVPGLNTSRSVALGVQLLGFEVAILLLSFYHDRPWAAVAGSVGVLVSVAGSLFMLRLSNAVRRETAPEAYLEVLFGSRFEIVSGLIAFVVMIVYVFIYDPGQPGPTLVGTLLGDRPSLLLAAVLLFVAWDVAYRIGVGWWASVVGLWRSIRFGDGLETPVRRRFRRLDGLTIAFAAVQLLVVPVLAGHPVLQVVLVGHVLAVAVVSGASMVILR